MTRGGYINAGVSRTALRLRRAPMTTKPWQNVLLNNFIKTKFNATPKINGVTVDLMTEFLQYFVQTNAVKPGVNGKYEFRDDLVKDFGDNKVMQNLRNYLNSSNVKTVDRIPAGGGAAMPAVLAPDQSVDIKVAPLVVPPRAAASSVGPFTGQYPAPSRAAASSFAPGTGQYSVTLPMRPSAGQSAPFLISQASGGAAPGSDAATAAELRVLKANMVKLEAQCQAIALLQEGNTKESDSDPDEATVKIEKENENLRKQIEEARRAKEARQAEEAERVKESRKRLRDADNAATDPRKERLDQALAENKRLKSELKPKASEPMSTEIAMGASVVMAAAASVIMTNPVSAVALGLGSALALGVKMAAKHAEKKK